MLDYAAMQPETKTTRAFSYIKQITSGGAIMFFKRLYASNFGTLTLKRIFSSASKRRKVLAELIYKQGKSDAASKFHLKNRSELQALLGAPALINDPEIAVFEKYSYQAKDTIAEIGCAYGGSSLLFLLNKRNETEVFSMDPFIKDSMGAFQASEEICRSRVAQALKDLGITDRLSKWHLIPDYSFNVVQTWTRSIDLLFIDGDHNYDAVKQDFEQWYPHVKVGGVIFFHDSARPEGAEEGKADHGWPGPSQLVREIKNGPRVHMLEQIYSISVFKKVNA